MYAISIRGAPAHYSKLVLLAQIEKTCSPIEFITMITATLQYIVNTSTSSKYARCAERCQITSKSFYCVECRQLYLIRDQTGWIPVINDGRTYS